MQLKDFARGVPDEVWIVFEPLLPVVAWKGNGRKPFGNRQCLHALLLILVSGIAWEMLPPGFPSAKTVQRRLKDWLKRDAFLEVWRRWAARDQALPGINGDHIFLDGSKKPATKGVTRRGQVRWIAASLARP